MDGRAPAGLAEGAGRWTFGLEPLPEAADAAARLRRVAGLVLALERPAAALDELLGALDRAERALSRCVPADPAPRVGPAADGDGRPYVDHSRHIGAFNACFPEYTIEVDGGRATGTVNFPVVYEGPPGLVHGGFLALFFDAAIQHHNCEVGEAGKTAGLELRYRRPTPLLTDLSFELTRTVEGTRIRSTGRLLAGHVVLCDARVDAVRGQRSRLPAVSPRRAS
ncbi:MULTISPECIES: PaaI family thioesterase [unclassified Pseudofrankia]|uniref:PaaI family thioesterase n=1 Tax=unclassified Pseudofrankia TaxID=2994372 RepID=UPI0008DA0937|nr:MULTISPECIES: hypothetical protein [unclassified Pseudofrankia]MDT3442702.1 hypothetical protein [Pseudofrankia sp. BMG5.37]OHV44280.1 hypothetical protein BCD48_25650 [Pseudofrankia sp. BMG5.36]